MCRAIFVAMNSEPLPSVCPNCGEPLPHEALYCRECGASEETGWNEPWTDEDEQREYEDFLRREFPDDIERQKPSVRDAAFVVVALLLVLIMLLLAFFAPL